MNQELIDTVSDILLDISEEVRRRIAFLCYSIYDKPVAQEIANRCAGYFLGIGKEAFIPDNFSAIIREAIKIAEEGDI